MRQLAIQMQVLEQANGLPGLGYRSAGDACLTLYASYDLVLLGDATVRVSTGIILGLPEGVAGHIMPHPSLAELGVFVVPEIISPDDRGPITVLLHTTKLGAWRIHRGDPIAQLLVQPFVQIRAVQVVKIASGPGAVFQPPQD